MDGRMDGRMDWRRRRRRRRAELTQEPRQTADNHDGSPEGVGGEMVRASEREREEMALGTQTGHVYVICVYVCGQAREWKRDDVVHRLLTMCDSCAQ